ncbi:MAG: sugar phosphate isomerase/epimerase [Hyphomicrobiaceae bacterium]|jgi:sugar phosphate isomerase/epimerase
MTNEHIAPRPQLGVISDETGPSLDGCIAFAVEHGLNQIEIRMVDGTAPLSLTDVQAKDANARIRAAGLTVAGIATPLLKWEAPGKKAADQGDQFGFSREGLSDDDLTMACIHLANLFETQNLRIFSYLTHENFVLDDLKPAFDRLLEHAEQHDMVLRLENEPVCNIASFAQLADIVELYDTPRLEALPDIGNSAQIDEFPDAALIQRVMPYTHHIHFKDYSKAAGKFVALGTGEVKLDAYMAEIAVGANGRQLSFSLETHTHDDPMGGTRVSAGQLIATTNTHFVNA